ncbi:unnamed protein product [Penicillium salamii]|uniref:Endoplasmic reticulum junction formation protein lunapark n=1 Tax=Penicillium salamii TaxID=1612424 RepID=A0A9W4JNU0_9EURO|nr:unnamed protein product [Penicillium salamii]CAG8215412.1 unnamed protein product [Penicillium salamii]CAG8246654.1 unnamed protein product [Penicillium salamii]CAG8272177.1 unnamed protein product [Penicillium salamii]CAG8272469.1 unnamed protein product [Penicillium salamii]
MMARGPCATSPSQAPVSFTSSNANMVSFWPWKGDDNSAASFEKTLSTLSTKITQTTTRLDQQRQSSRRVKALWTLYSTFAYLFYTITITLVFGWDNWGMKEYAAIAGGPVVIYGIRKLSSKFFDYQISRNQARLDEFHKQREETIEKLKVATKYNTTQELLEKYGAESPKASPAPKGETGKENHVQPSQPAPRTGLPPPPTANIHRPIPPQTPNFSSPQPPSPPVELAQGPPQVQQSPSPYPPSSAEQAGFAPNAYSNSGEYIEQPHWYDRLLDVLLGEDETQPRNRMVMICSGCRLVNGQAPPGIKTLDELGRWRCGSCGIWNGVESEATQILSSLRQDAVPVGGSSEALSKADADPQSSEGSDEAVMVASSEEEQSEDPKPEPVRRSKRSGKGKAKE